MPGKFELKHKLEIKRDDESQTVTVMLHKETMHQIPIEKIIFGFGEFEGIALHAASGNHQVINLIAESFNNEVAKGFISLYIHKDNQIVQKFNFSRFELSNSEKHDLIEKFMGVLRMELPFSDGWNAFFLQEIGKFCPKTEAASSQSSSTTPSSSSLIFFSNVAQGEEQGVKRGYEDVETPVSNKKAC